jgi:hypothetical protein
LAWFFNPFFNQQHQLAWLFDMFHRHQLTWLFDMFHQHQLTWLLETVSFINNINWHDF